jgi:Ca-activated chloride channel family protein
MRLGELSWLWPQMLWLLAILPLAWWYYRARRVRQAASNPQGFWFSQPAPRSRLMHLPFLLVLVGLGILIMAAARPQAVVMLPQRVDAVMLVLDISGSMRADDVAPSRIEAASEAIRRFVSRQPPQMKLGLVTVAATATISQMPTTNRDALFTVLDGIALQQGSALGAGIAVGMSALLPPGSVPLQAILEGTFKEADLPLSPVAKRDDLAIVLLSDGADNMAPDVRTMARFAAQQGIRIYTVGIGTTQGTLLKAAGMSMRVRLEEDTLKWVAAETSAEYFSAASVSELHRIYEVMGRTIVFRQQKQTEVTALLLLAASVFLMGGLAFSLVRTGRVA